MYQMTDHAFYTVWGEALKASDRDAYVSDWATSTLFLPDEDPDAPISQNLIQDLGQIWDVAHMTMADLRAAAGLTQAALAERYCIPRRTIECWESRSPTAHRDCPDYVRLLIARDLGLIKV